MDWGALGSRMKSGMQMAGHAGDVMSGLQGEPGGIKKGLMGIRNDATEMHYGTPAVHSVSSAMPVAGNPAGAMPPAPAPPPLNVGMGGPPPIGPPMSMPSPMMPAGPSGPAGPMSPMSIGGPPRAGGAGSPVGPRPGLGGIAQY